MDGLLIAEKRNIDLQEKEYRFTKEKEYTS